MTDPVFDVAGRRIFVTGGARGLGQSICGALAERGATVVVADRLPDEAEAVAGALPGQGHSAVTIDVASEQSVEAAVAEARGAGELDVVINSAGVAEFAPAVSMSLAQFEKTIAVNLTGAFLLSRCAARAMLERGEGSIVHLASVSSCVVNPEYAAYSTSKAGLSQLVRILALEWAEQGVRINAIGPAMTETPLTREHIIANQEGLSKALSKIPMGRLGTPADIIGAVLLLASSAGSFMTGQTIYVDGGRTLL